MITCDVSPVAMFDDDPIHNHNHKITSILSLQLQLQLQLQAAHHTTQLDSHIKYPCPLPSLFKNDYDKFNEIKVVVDQKKTTDAGQSDGFRPFQVEPGIHLYTIFHRLDYQT